MAFHVPFPSCFVPDHFRYRSHTVVIGTAVKKQEREWNGQELDVNGMGMERDYYCGYYCGITVTIFITVDHFLNYFFPGKF